MRRSGRNSRERHPKLEIDVKLVFDGLYAHDLQGQAAAFQKLIQDGIEMDKAVALSRLLAHDQAMIL